MQTYFSITKKHILQLVFIVLIGAVFVLVSYSNAEVTKVGIGFVGPGSDETKLIDIPPGSSLLSPSLCPTWFGDDTACMSGHQEATILHTKIQNDTSSLIIINHRIRALQETIEYLASFSEDNLNGLNITAYPAGELVQRTYGYADSIVPKCVFPPPPDPPYNLDVGNLSSYKANYFSLISQNQFKDLVDITLSLSKLREIASDMTVSATSTAFEKLLIGLKNTPGVIKAAKIVAEFENVLKKDFIPVVGASGAGNFMAVDLSWNLQKGKRDVTKLWSLKHPFVSALTTPLRAALLPFKIKVPTSITSMSMSGSIGLNGEMDGVNYPNVVENFSFNTALPEADIFKTLNASINLHMKIYQELKTKLEKDKAELQKQLDALIANSYNCG